MEVLESPDIVRQDENIEYLLRNDVSNEWSQPKRVPMLDTGGDAAMAVLLKSLGLTSYHYILLVLGY